MWLTDLQWARLGEELAMAYLIRHGWTLEDLRESKFYQDRDVDFHIAKGLQAGYIEVKYDRRIGGASGKPPTSNLYIEYISNTATRSPGWFVKSTADRIWYIDAATKDCYIFSLDELKQHIASIQLPTTRAKDYRKDGSYKESEGYLLPLSQAKQFKSFRQINLDN